MSEDLNTESNFKFIAFSKQGIELLQKLTTKQITSIKKINKKSSELTSADINILLYILNNLTYENTSTIPPQKEICIELNLSQKQVSISINKLIDKEIIIKIKPARTYFISPKYFYLGTDRKNKIIKWKKLIKQNN